jgi:uncharacterized protein (TIGR02300 family)
VKPWLKEVRLLSPTTKVLTGAPHRGKRSALEFRGVRVAKPELGEKQLCPQCASKFYDLGKRPAVCPKCQTAFDPSDETVKLKRVKTRAPAYEPDYEDEEEKPKRRPTEGEDGFEEEVEEAPELDQEAPDEPVLTTEDDDEEAPSPDALPAGFSETDEDSEGVAVDEDDDGVPLLEDDEEFPDDEIGDVADDDDEER